MAAKLCTDVGQLKVGQHVIDSRWPQDRKTTIADVRVYSWAIGYRKLYMHVSGPCKHCREGAGMVRRPDGEWVACGECYGGWL